MNEHKDKLKALGNSADNNVMNYSFTKPDVEILEKFNAPFSYTEDENSYQTIKIIGKEFTSVCPITKQPDFGTIIIRYLPDKWCVESKSLKLYLGAFRNHGAFHETCVHKICCDLFKLLEPFHIEVLGKFASRGGITIHPKCTMTKRTTND